MLFQPCADRNTDGCTSTYPYGEAQGDIPQCSADGDADPCPDPSSNCNPPGDQTAGFYFFLIVQLWIHLITSLQEPVSLLIALSKDPKAQDLRRRQVNKSIA